MRYATGEGVANGDVEVAKWYRKSAEQGDADAQHKLAISYALGGCTTQNQLEAYKWVRLAAAQEIAQARSSQESLELGLTPEPLAEGKRLLREWNPKMDSEAIYLKGTPENGFCGKGRPHAQVILKLHKCPH